MLTLSFRLDQLFQIVRDGDGMPMRRSCGLLVARVRDVTYGENVRVGVEGWA